MVDRFAGLMRAYISDPRVPLCIYDTDFIACVATVLPYNSRAVVFFVGIKRWDCGAAVHFIPPFPRVLHV